MQLNLTQSGTLVERQRNQERLYLPALDGLRFLAFFAVLLNHIPPSPELALLYTLHTRGWVGVELFFAISAYLFFILFQAEYKQTGRIAFADFFIRRFLRIYPLMIAAPAILTILMWDQLDLGAALRELTQIALFTNNLFWFGDLVRANPHISHLWTLSFEFQVYLFLPIAFLVYTKVGTKNFLMVLSAISIACLGLRTLYAVEGVSFVRIYYSPVLRPDSILLGTALALFASGVQGHVRTAIIVLIISTIAFFALPNINVPGLTAIALYPVAAAMCGSLLWLSLKAPSLTAFLSSRVLVYLGKRSYGLYVLHLPAIYLAKAYVLPLLPWPPSGPVSLFFSIVVASLAISIALADLSYRFIEKPFLRLKDKRAAVLSRPV